ncbi:MAG: ankyrin repeat domain-containing protein [Rickettsiaceae bacterium]|nr:ankyrin repeat domain-containing protein [Rickettsiaceae bacterium]
MKKGILTLLIITLFSCCYSYADNLPSLPLESNIVHDSPEDKGEKSLWQKIKGFLGFGEEEKAKEAIEKEEVTTSKQESDQANITEENNSALEDKNITTSENNDNFIDLGNKELPSAKEQQIESDESVNTDEDIKELFTDQDIVPKEVTLDTKGKANKQITKNTEESIDIENKTTEFTQTDQPSKKPSSEQQLPVETTDNKKDSSKEEKSFIDFGDSKLPVHQDSNNQPIEIDDNIKELFTAKDIDPDADADGLSKKTTEQATKKDDKITKEEVSPEINLSPITPKQDDKKEMAQEADPQIPSDPKVAEKEIAGKKEEKDEAILPEKTMPQEASVEDKPKIDKFKQQLEKNIASSREDLPKISEKEEKKVEQLPKKYVTNIQGHEHTTLEKKQHKFVNNEAKVLVLPNDDVVLGKLTEKAAIEQMDIRTYVQLFRKNYSTVRAAREIAIVDEFINNYDENFNPEKFSQTIQDKYYGLDQAFKAIKRNDLPTLINMLDNYNILQLKDDNNNNLLHMAAYTGNYSAAKLLLMKGINLNAKNNKHQSPLFIARKKRNPMLRQLLEKAGAR